MRKAAFHTLGCKVNSYETEAMQQLLEAAGYRIVPFAEGADVYIINTCSVTNVADRKSRQMLHRAKKMNPQAVVVAVGCYVQAKGTELKADEAVDIIIGNNCKMDLVSCLDEYFKEQAKDYIIDISESHEYEELCIDKIAGHTRAFIKVQDGCNQFCAYCIIPYTRGRVRSRQPESVLKEVQALVANGYREIVLTGIHLSSYGVDFNGDKKTNLLELILKLHEVEGLDRIRLGSLEPRIVTEAFVRTIASLPKLCPHFHLSLQSGCDATLKRMNRRYSTAEFAKGCELLRQAFENPAITTDVIVGFPGETEAEFEETRQFIEAMQFYEMHIFKYSVREGTKAADLPDHIPESLKSKRSDSLLALEKQMSLAFRKRFLGMERDILIEEMVIIEGKEYQIGHTREYIKVVTEGKEVRKNQIITGRLDCIMNDEMILLTENCKYSF